MGARRSPVGSASLITLRARNCAHDVGDSDEALRLTAVQGQQEGALGDDDFAATDGTTGRDADERLALPQGDGEREGAGEIGGVLRFAADCDLSLIHISEPTRLGMISYAVFCLKKKKKIKKKIIDTI